VVQPAVSRQRHQHGRLRADAIFEAGLGGATLAAKPTSRAGLAIVIAIWIALAAAGAWVLALLLRTE
jgi:hypothetical protein